MNYEFQLVDVSGGDLTAARAAGARGWHVVGVAQHVPGTITLVMERTGDVASTLSHPTPALQIAGEAMDPMC